MNTDVKIEGERARNRALDGDEVILKVVERPAGMSGSI